MKLKFSSKQNQEQISVAMGDDGLFLSSKSDIAQVLMRGSGLEGTYSFALMLDDERAFLARDSLGTRKLFYFRDFDNEILYVSNNFLELTDRFDAKHIFSVPKGGYLIINSKEVCRTKHHEQKNGPLEFDIKHVESVLANFFKYLRLELKKKPVICLSGGLDSTIIAYYATKEFGRIDVVTGVLRSQDSSLGCLDDDSDFAHAQQIANWLNAIFRPVFINHNAIMNNLADILRASQDWRDYNVHCAALNYFLAKNIEDAFDKEKYVILTGDFMNEIFADYTSEFFQGKEYYKQPNFSQKTRQRFFMNGLDTSDREIGVFSRFNLDCIQPYSFIANYYRRLTDSQLSLYNSKYAFNGQIIPDSLLKRVAQSKVRAQVGDKNGGILGHFINSGLSPDKLLEFFCKSFSLDQNFLNQFIQVGAYKIKDN